VSYSVPANNSGGPRTGTLTVAGQTVTVTESDVNRPTPPGHLRVKSGDH
jgi:hypothetical protein